MSIAFNTIPSPATWRVPGVMTEGDLARAAQGPADKPYRALFLVPRTSAGTLVQKTKQQKIVSADQVRALCGAGSIGYQIARAWFAQPISARILDVDLIAVDDNGAGAAAALTLAFSGTATAAGNVPLYIGGKPVLVPVASGATASQVATDVRAAINAADGLAVTASGTTGNVIITCNHKGALGNEIYVRMGYYPEEALAAGLAVTGANATLTGGTTNPTLDTTVWSVLGEVQYDVIVMPWNDSTSLSAIMTEMAGREATPREVGGNVFVGKRDTSGNLSTFGAALNAYDLVVLGGKMLEPPWMHAARAAAQVGASLAANEGIPVRTLPLLGELPELDADRFTPVERNLILFDGISTSVVDAAGQKRLERVITTYQTDPGGAQSTAYLDINQPYLLRYIRWDLRRRFAAFARYSLVPDGTTFDPGLSFISPAIARGVLEAAAGEWERSGRITNAKALVATAIVEINATDPTRLDIRIQPDLTKGFMQAAVQIQFK